jgi:acyl-CoA synthetase (AMP-forming)/AMP-acid ligase II
VDNGPRRNDTCWCDSEYIIPRTRPLLNNRIKAFPISPRNSSTAICHVLRTVSSHRLIVTESSLDSLVNDVKAELASSDYDLNIHELPSLSDIYPHLSQESQDDAFEPILLSSRTESPDDAVLYIRSSGSTGLPKSVPLTNELFSKLTYDALVEPWKDWQDPYCGFFVLLLLFVSDHTYSPCHSRLTRLPPHGSMDALCVSAIRGATFRYF